ncbi:MAG: hypothetical protein WBL44_04470 [Nitrososphaeraceae archaeon]
MKFKPYVCTLCSQDFTRKYSGYRHNRDLHNGHSKIVRMVDYVVGRISGQYHPDNPFAYRSKQKQYNPAGNHSDVMSGSFPLASIVHDSPAYAKDEVQRPNQQLSINSVQYSIDSTKAATSKFDEIIMLCSTLHFQPQTTKVFLKRLSVEVINNGGKEAILDSCLEALRNNLNMMEASHYLLDNSNCEVKSAPRVPLHNHHVEDLRESTKAKLAQIEQILAGTKHEAFVWEDVERLIKQCKSAADHSFLDHELESYQRTISGYGTTCEETEDKVFFSPEVREQIQFDSPQQNGVRNEGYENGRIGSLFQNGYQNHPSQFFELGRLPWSNDSSTKSTSSSIPNADLESDLKRNEVNGQDLIKEVPTSEESYQELAHSGPDKNWTTQHDEEKGVYTKIDCTKTLKSNDNHDQFEYGYDLTKIHRSPGQVTNDDFVIGNDLRIIRPNPPLAKGKPRFPRPLESRNSLYRKHLETVSTKPGEGQVGVTLVTPMDNPDMLISIRNRHEAQGNVEVGLDESFPSHQLSDSVSSIDEETVGQTPEGSDSFKQKNRGDASNLDLTEMMRIAMGMA